MESSQEGLLGERFVTTQQILVKKLKIIGEMPIGMLIVRGTGIKAGGEKKADCGNAP
jgi:hypothetical protein